MQNACEWGNIRNNIWLVVIVMQAREFFAMALNIKDEKIISDVADASSFVHIPQGEVLLKEGELQQEMWFLVNGIIRFFYFDVNGQEITDCFVATPRMPIMARPKLLLPSAVYIEASIDSDLFSIPAQEIDRLLNQYSELLQLYNNVLMDAFTMHWEIKTMVCRNTAMQRYQWFLEAYPGFIDKVSNKHIASFLGMTPVTLSRLRRVLREKGG